MAEEEPTGKNEDELETEELEIAEDGVNGDFVKGADGIFEFVERKPGSKMSDTQEFTLPEGKEITSRELILKDAAGKIELLGRRERELEGRQKLNRRLGLLDNVDANENEMRELQVQINIIQEEAKKKIVELGKQKSAD